MAEFSFSPIFHFPPKRNIVTENFETTTQNTKCAESLHLPPKYERKGNGVEILVSKRVTVHNREEIVHFQGRNEPLEFWVKAYGVKPASRTYDLDPHESSKKLGCPCAFVWSLGAFAYPFCHPYFESPQIRDTKSNGACKYTKTLEILRGSRPKKKFEKW
jgi:hypothetical protein